MKRVELSTNTPEEYRSGNDWRMDPSGYCIIKVFYSKQVIGVRHYPAEGTEADYEFVGDDSYELVLKLISEGLITKKHHAAYLGHELQKAQTAMRLKIEYVQDERLDFNKPFTKDPSENTR
jgi:tetrahydromethanopterin S-methyltransferase subunit A